MSVVTQFYQLMDDVSENGFQWMICLFVGMHLHHYANTSLSGGLASCTSWSKSMNIRNVDFHDWLQCAEEKHLVADLAMGVAEGVIRMVFSGVNLNAKVCYNSQCTHTTSKGVLTRLY